MTLVRVTAPHYCAGLEVESDRVVRAAPILKWAVGRDWSGVRAYFRGKRFRVEVVPHGEQR